LLPRPLPTPPRAELAAGLRPTQHLAGDFYNAFRLDGDHVGFYVGDVMGHGPAAALLAVFALMTIRTKRIDGNRYEIRPPAEVLADLNHTLLEADIPGQPFLTLVYGVLDTAARNLTYCNGGHPHPIVLGLEHEPLWLEPTGPLLGVLQLPFEEAVVPLVTGDRVILYSDGAMTANWGMAGYGTDGLVERLKQRDGSPLQGLIDDALASVSFNNDLADDIAVLAVELQE
jgi:sigma-B regulation protein RsbU (phosphoserine phosphatase)